MKQSKVPYTIPYEGEPPDQILEKIEGFKKKDVAWKAGRAWSLVYCADETHEALLKDAGEALFSTNYLNPLAFRSLNILEQQVIRMTAHLLHGPEQAAGVMTTGGTESILLALLAYRQRARVLKPEITAPEVVVPATIHPAFDKAAVLFGLSLRKAAVDESYRAQPAAMEALINENTIALAASAPSYPHGMMDPIPEIGEIAVRHDLPFHVDACIGGFMLPWVEQLGYEVPPWDFRVPGVTSISADAHKFGFAAKGASTLTYRSMDYLRHQFVVTTDYPGGIYISPTLLGSRAGGPIAAAWAAMRHLGEKGYLSIARVLMEGAERLRSGIGAMPGLHVLGGPCMNLLSYTTVDGGPDIFVIADQLEEKGWMSERQQFPDSIHLTVLPTNVGVIDQYLEDLQAAYDFAMEHPQAAAKGKAALYGMMARVPFRGMVEKSVKKLMEELYGPAAADETSELQIDTPTGLSGLMSRLFSGWEQLKRAVHRGKAILRLFWFLLLSFLMLGVLSGQPYVDPLQVRYTYAPGDRGTATPFTHLWAGSDLPIQFGHDRYLLLSPFYEQWRIDLNNQESVYPTVHSLALPVGLILPLGQSGKWSLTALSTLRWNGHELFGDRTFQYGGATLVGYTLKTQQTFRLGVYANKEFFGWLVVPLVGIDWRLGDRDYLFGTLPGRLSYEHQWSRQWYGGATFRAPTNSYRLPNGEYLRIDEAQLSLYLDHYLSAHICITAEAGYGLFRKLRTGRNGRDYLTEVNWNDGPFLRVSAAYRIRL